jgi:hypothetical protein
MSGEVMGCQQIDIDAHRWYVVIRITLEDGTDMHRVIYDPDRSGLVIYDSVAEFEAARDG